MQRRAFLPILAACAVLASCEPPVKVAAPAAVVVARHVLRIYSPGTQVYDETSGVPTLVAEKDGDPTTRIEVPFAVGFYDRDPAGTLVRRPAGALTVRVLLMRRGFLPRRITATAPWNSSNTHTEEDARYGTSWNFEDVFEVPSVPFLPGLSDAHRRAWLTGRCDEVLITFDEQEEMRRALDARRKVSVGSVDVIVNQERMTCKARSQRRRAGSSDRDWDPPSLGVPLALAESPDRAVTHLSATDPQTATALDELVRAMESERFGEASAIADRVSARLLPKAPGNAALTLQLPGALFADASLRLARQLVSIGSTRDALEAARDALAAAPLVADREFRQIRDARVAALIEAAEAEEARDPILARARLHAALSLRPGTVAALEGLRRTQAVMRVAVREATNARPLVPPLRAETVAAPASRRPAARPGARGERPPLPAPVAVSPAIAWSYAEVSKTREAAWEQWNSRNAERSAEAIDRSARAAVVILGIAELEEEIWPERERLPNPRREELLDALPTFFP